MVVELIGVMVVARIPGYVNNSRLLQMRFVVWHADSLDQQQSVTRLICVASLVHIALLI